MIYTERGMSLARKAIALACSENSDEALDLASRRWGPASPVAQVLRSGIAAAATGGSWGTELAREMVAEFLDLARPRTIIGKLEGLRRVPRRVPVLRRATGAAAYWVGRGKAIPVSAGAFSREEFAPLKIGALQVFSADLLEDSSPEAEALILRDLVAAYVELADRTFIDPTNGGIANQSPASITYGVSTIDGLGDLIDSLQAAVGQFTGSLETAAWVLHPRLAIKIGLQYGGKGQAVDLGARGGSLAGLPAITSEASEFDSDNGSITLIDPSNVVVVEGGLTMSRTTEGAVEMDNAPTGDAATPTAATTLVSLFQTESVGIKIVREINWSANDGATVRVSGAGIGS